MTYKNLLVKWIYNLINTVIKRSKFKFYFRETMVGENRYKIKLKGAFEYYNVESWARAKKGGTAELNFVPLGLRPFFIIKKLEV